MRRAGAVVLGVLSNLFRLFQNEDDGFFHKIGRGKGTLWPFSSSDVIEGFWHLKAYEPVRVRTCGTKIALTLARNTT